MRKKPYLIDGIIGNGNMLLSFSNDGNIQRLNWPRVDYIDQISNQWSGIYEQDQHHTDFFHDDSFRHEQLYHQDTNILVTKHTGNGWKVEQVDYVVPDADLWIRDYEITNEKPEARVASFLYYSDSALEGTGKFQTTLFDLEADSLLHYYRNTAMSITPFQTTDSYQAGKAKSQAEINQLEGRTILNHPEGAFSIDLGSMETGEKKKVTISISLAETREEAAAVTKTAKQTGEAALRRQTEDYWLNVLEKRKKFNIKDEKADQLYKRSILAFHLLRNRQTGAFIAGPEVDEEYDYSGGYAYCWGRDAAFIASAVDAAGFHETVEDFYRFVAATQNADGSWEQRYYTDGVLAPSWGMQVDEIGSVLWGMYHHYEETKNEDFRKEMWPSVKKGADFLSGFVDPETDLPLPSKDLWEKRDGEHLYSSAAVYGGLIGASLFAKLEGQSEAADFYKQKADSMKTAVNSSGYSQQDERYARSLKLSVTKEAYQQEMDAGNKVLHTQNAKGVIDYQVWQDMTPDISLLGLNYPFGMIDASDEKLVKTAQTIEELCTSKKTGGLERFPGDVYIGGNPWIIATLWLAIYKVKTSDHKQAVELFNWATEQANHLNLLPEQIDKETGEPAWVMPLTWSHAMYVLAIEELTAFDLI